MRSTDMYSTTVQYIHLRYVIHIFPIFRIVQLLPQCCITKKHIHMSINNQYWSLKVVSYFFLLSWSTKLPNPVSVLSPSNVFRPHISAHAWCSFKPNCLYIATQSPRDNVLNFLLYSLSSLLFWHNQIRLSSKHLSFIFKCPGCRQIATFKQAFLY